MWAIKKSGRSKLNIKKVKKIIIKKPDLSTQKLAQKLKLKKSTVWNILKKDLKLTPYKLSKHQLLSTATATKRIVVKNLRNVLKKIIKTFFSQMKKFLQLSL